MERWRLIFHVLLVAVAVTPSPAHSDNRTIVIGGNRDYPPYDFIDQNGEPAGFNVDLSRAIAEVMGMNVEIRLQGWAGLREALRDGRIDALQGISYSDVRATEFDFTPPYTVVHHSIFARTETRAVASLDGLPGHTILLHRKGIMDDFLTARGLGKDLVRTDTPGDALRLLASGKGDYAVVASVPGEYMIREFGLENLRAVARRVSSQQYCYAVRKGNLELLTRFNEGMAILRKTGRFQTIYQKWLGAYEPVAFTWGMAVRYGAVFVLPLLLGLGGSLLWSRSLRHQVAQRTASLASEVAERKRAMEELHRNQQQLVQADKMAALGVLVSGVAHEINNPNGLILLNVPTLKEAHLDAREILDTHFREHGDFDLAGTPYSEMRDQIPCMFDEMADGARRIKRIVEDLKDFARQQDVPSFGLLDLNDIVRTGLRLLDRPIRKATRRFSVRYGDALPKIRGDAQRLEQVIVNLVLNACQALTDPDRAVEVSTSYDPKGRRVVLQVRDEGVGIAPEHLSRVTEPFFTTRRETGGTGLGLSVSAGIIKEHGGTLEIASVPGQSTVVALALPAAEEGGS